MLLFDAPSEILLTKNTRRPEIKKPKNKIKPKDRKTPCVIRFKFMFFNIVFLLYHIILPISYHSTKKIKSMFFFQVFLKKVFQLFNIRNFHFIVSLINLRDPHSGFRPGLLALCVIF